MAGAGEKIKQTVEQGLHQMEGKSAAGKRILIVATSHDKLGNSNQLTGCWAEELAAAYYIFKDAGADVDVASVKGGKIPMDETSFGENFMTDYVRRYLGDEELKQYVENSLYVKDARGNYDAIYFPGGHGIAFDGPEDKNVIAIGEKFWAEGKVVSAVCHGPNALVGTRAPDGTPIVKGRRVAGFSNAEEKAVGKVDVVPFLLEDKLKELGGLYESGPDWQPKAIADGKLITGQNPASTALLAKLVLKAL